MVSFYYRKARIYQMSKKEDLRVKKTKIALFDAFTELMSEEKFENINVNSLCDKAGIRRATFYKHFSDKYDFSTYYIRALRVKFDNRADVRVSLARNDTTYFADYAKRIVEFIDENDAIFSNLLKSNLFPVIYNMIICQNYKDTRDRLQESVDSGLKLHSSVDSVASMITGGVATTIYVWLVSGKTTSTDDLANELSKLINIIIEGKQ